MSLQLKKLKIIGLLTHESLGISQVHFNKFNNGIVSNQ